MSRFIDRVKKVTGDTPRPIGFGVARESVEKSRILLVANPAQNNVGKVAGVCDAVLLQPSESKSSSRAIKGAVKAVSEVPCGLWLSGSGDSEVESAAGAGIDFVVFPSDVSMAVLKKEDKTGKIMELPSTMEVSLLRAANELAVDAVLVSGEAGKENQLTCQTLMRFQLCAGLLEKPLLAIVPVSISTDELKTLWEAGIIGVVIAVADTSDVEKIAVLYGEIEKTTFPTRRRHKKMEVSLPSVGGKAEAREEEEEEEEDE